jgi:hypothetical protein
MKLGALLSGGPLNGIKMLVGYFLANLAAGHPLFVDAVNKTIEEPSTGNIINVVAQGLLIWGGFHDIVKKVK